MVKEESRRRRYDQRRFLFLFIIGAISWLQWVTFYFADCLYMDKLQSSIIATYVFSSGGLGPGQCSGSNLKPSRRRGAALIELLARCGRRRRLLVRLQELLLRLGRYFVHLRFDEVGNSVSRALRREQLLDQRRDAIALRRLENPALCLAELFSQQFIVEGEHTAQNRIRGDGGKVGHPKVAHRALLRRVVVVGLLHRPHRALEHADVAFKRVL